MDTERFAVALGRAVIGAWGDLQQEIQQLLFERAVVAGHHTERDRWRKQMAAFLHDKHPPDGRLIPEPEAVSKVAGAIQPPHGRREKGPPPCRAPRAGPLREPPHETSFLDFQDHRALRPLLKPVDVTARRS